MSSALGLVGLVSFDFILAGDEPFLIEVNPRPGATLDVFDDADGTLFAAHLAACAGAAAATTRSAGRPRRRRFSMPTGVRSPPPALAWPEWTADRPAPGTRIPRHRPIATVFAAEATAEAAFDSCRGRLDELAEMLYAQAPNRERNDNAEVQRPRPERLGARSEAR